MPRRDDEDDDDRPRRRRNRDDEDDDRRARPRARDNDEDRDRPVRSRRRRDEDDDDRPRRRKKSNTGLVLGIIGGVLLLCCGGGGVVAYLMWGRVSSAVQEDRTTSTNLQQVGLAIHHHQDVLGQIPHNSYAPDGKPLLSWRVHLLPYLPQEGPALYGRFKLDEPWDGPNNRQLIAQMPRVYGSPKANSLAGPGKTFYRGFSHENAIFEKPRAPGQVKRLSFAQILDGLSSTIFVIDAGEAVEWTKPDDIDWAPGRPRPALGGATPGLPFCYVLMGDGSVRRMRKDVDDQTLRNLIGYRDGFVIQPVWEHH